MAVEKTEHDGLGTGFYCPTGDSEQAYIDFVRDDEGYLIAMICTCTVCETIWSEKA